MRNLLHVAAGLTDNDMLWLLSMGKLRKLKPGERLVQAGKPIADLFFVTGGSLAVLLADGTHVATLGAGDVIGEMSFVERQAPSASVRSEEASEVMCVPRDLILARFEQDPEFGVRFYRALAVFLSERLRETTAAVRMSEAERKEQDQGRTASTDRFSRLTGMFTRRSA
jgi:CRP/FNR family cyclic AMP-dependent transcriptional regulator